MAHSENSRESEGNVFVADIVNGNDGEFDPVRDAIEDCMPGISSDKDGTYVGLHRGQDECILKDGCPSENLIHLGEFCCDKRGGRDWKPQLASPKELDQRPNVSSNSQGGGGVVDPTSIGSQGTGMGLLGKRDFGADLESGGEINGPSYESSFLGSARGLVVKAWCSFMRGDFTRTFDGDSISGTEATDLALNQKLNELIVSKPAEKPNLSQPSTEKADSRVVKITNTGSRGAGKLRTENGKVNPKPSCKKPPRPPRPPRTAPNPSRERLIKGISDMGMLRAAKLERMRSLKKSKVAKSSSSDSSVWALMFTLCFCVIMIMQGLYSQGTGGPRDSSATAVETSPISVHTYDKHATRSEPLQATMDKLPLLHPSRDLEGIKLDLSDQI